MDWILDSVNTSVVVEAVTVKWNGAGWQEYTLWFSCKTCLSVRRRQILVEV